MFYSIPNYYFDINVKQECRITKKLVLLYNRFLSVPWQ